MKWWSAVGARGKINLYKYVCKHGSWHVSVFLNPVTFTLTCNHIRWPVLFSSTVTIWSTYSMNWYGHSTHPSPDMTQFLNIASHFLCLLWHVLPSLAEPTFPNQSVTWPRGTRCTHTTCSSLMNKHCTTSIFTTNRESLLWYSPATPFIVSSLQRGSWCFSSRNCRSVRIKKMMQPAGCRPPVFLPFLSSKSQIDDICWVWYLVPYLIIHLLGKKKHFTDKQFRDTVVLRGMHMGGLEKPLEGRMNVGERA